MEGEEEAGGACVMPIVELVVSLACSTIPSLCVNTAASSQTTVMAASYHTPHPQPSPPNNQGWGRDQTSVSHTLAKLGS